MKNFSRSKREADMMSNRDFMRDSVVIGSAQCQAGLHEIAEGVCDALALAMSVEGVDSVEVNLNDYVMVMTRKQ